MSVLVCAFAVYYSWYVLKFVFHWYLHQLQSTIELVARMITLEILAKFFLSGSL